MRVSLGDRGCAGRSPLRSAIAVAPDCILGPLSPPATSRAGGRPALRAAGWMAASIASFILMSVAARQLTGRMTTIQILCLRSVVALIVMLALWPRLGADAFAT